VSVRNCEHPVSVGDVIYRAGHRSNEPQVASSRARQVGGLALGVDRLDAPHFRLDADQCCDLALVAAQHGDLHFVEKASRSHGAVPRRSCAHRIEHDRNAMLVSRLAGKKHRVDPVR